MERLDKLICEVYKLAWEKYWLALKKIWQAIYKHQIFEDIYADFRKLSILFITLDLIFIAFVIWAWLHPLEIPGVAAASMGLLAIVIAFRSKPCKTDKIIWIVIATLLFTIESRSIVFDRDANANEQMLSQISENQNFEDVLSRESSDFETILNTESDYFDNVLRTQEQDFQVTNSSTKAIIANQLDLKRTDYQRVADAYSTTGELMQFANMIRLENPDSSDNLRGYYIESLEKMLNNAHLTKEEKKRRKVLLEEKFKIEKLQFWKHWQVKVTPVVRQVNASEKELLEHLTKYDDRPPSDVAQFLSSTKLTHNAYRDSKIMDETAVYVRGLADRLNSIFSYKKSAVNFSLPVVK